MLGVVGLQLRRKLSTRGVSTHFAVMWRVISLAGGRGKAEAALRINFIDANEATKWIAFNVLASLRERLRRGDAFDRIGLLRRA